MLAVESLSVTYGGLTALCEISLAVGSSQFVSIVGPNGAGKTTLFKAISGTLRPSGGSIHFEDRDLLAVAPSERAHLGIGAGEIAGQIRAPKQRVPVERLQDLAQHTLLDLGARPERTARATPRLRFHRTGLLRRDLDDRRGRRHALHPAGRGR